MSKHWKEKQLFQDRPFTAKSYYDFLKEKRLMGSLCDDCKALMVPPRMTCMECRGNKLKWSQLSGKGSLATFTVVHVAPTFLKDKAPYAVGIVKLEEGPHLPGMIKNVKLEELRIGIDVAVDFETALPREWPKWPRYFFKTAR